MMEKTKIGLNAGKVWRILNEKGELSMFDLCRELSLTFEDVALAIGWLARESKVFLRKREGMLFASVENVEFTFLCTVSPAAQIIEVMTFKCKFEDTFLLNDITHTIFGQIFIRVDRMICPCFFNGWKCF